MRNVTQMRLRRFHLPIVVLSAGVLIAANGCGRDRSTTDSIGSPEPDTLQLPSTDQEPESQTGTTDRSEATLGGTDQAIARIRELGGSLSRADDRPGSAVIGVGLNYQTIPAGSLEVLKSFPDLERLSLTDVSVDTKGERIGDKELAPISELTNLKELSLRGTRITGTGLSYLTEMIKLEKLDLCHCPISDGLEALKGLVQLRELDLGKTGIDDAGAEPLSALTSLEILNFRETSITPAGVKHLSPLSRLKTLRLEVVLNDEALAAIGALTELEELDAGLHDVTDTGLASISGLTKLRKLVAQRETTDAGLAHIGRMAGLRELRINSEHLTDAGVAHLSELKELRDLCLLSSAKLGNGALEAIGKLDNLTRLDLSGDGGFSGPGVGSLKSLKNLRYLSLGGEQIDDAGLEQLVTLGSLEVVELKAPNVTDAGVEHLRRRLPKCRISN